MNILLICLVPVRADRLSCFGYRRDTTPNLDALAADGTTFLNAYATAPWTPPSYSSVITGIYPWNNGVMGEANLAPTYPTIASHLRSAGYRTAAFVTAHHVGATRGMVGGFDEVVQVGSGPRDKGSTDTTFLATKWLERARRDSQPFFLTVHYHEVHHPYLPPKGHRGRYSNMRKVRDNEEIKQASRDPHAYMAGNPTPATLGLLSDLYDDELAYLDRQHLRPLLKQVEDLGLLENTVIVVASLHGDSLGEHGLLSHAAELYEPTVHVPLIIRHPKHLRGVRVADLVQLTDIFPTLSEFVAAPAPEAIDGWPIRAFVPQARRRTFVAAQWFGAKGGGWRKRIKSGAFSESTFLARVTTEQLMLREGRFKYISAPAEELFDVIKDPAELTNLAEKYPSQVAVLRGQLQRLVADRVPVPHTPPLPPDVARDLRRMGYFA